MAFNPSSFTGTQNAGVKPQVLTYWSGSYSSSSGGTWVEGTNVTEGASAVVGFGFYNPGETNLSTPASFIELKDSAVVKLSWDGTSAADVTGPGEFGVRTLSGDWIYTALGTTFSYTHSNGVTYNVASTTGGVITFDDSNDLDPMIGTGATGVSLRLPVKVDNIAENGEHVLVKFTQSSSTYFTNSNYVEGKVDIVDAVSAVVPAINTTTAADPTKQEVFRLPSTSVVYKSSTTMDDYSTISGFGTGDKLEVNIADTSTPSLSMVNFGSLAPVGITTEELLINGLRALNNTDCNQGGLYMMGVGTSTYIIFDSTNDGKLDTDGSGTDDVFVELTGINPSFLQSTHFQLI